MEILKFGDAPSPKRSNNNGRKSGPMIVAGLMVAMMGMSTTLAGTITIGTNNAVEFGQGLVTTAACDSAITVTPTSSYSTSTDTFTVSTLKISDVAAACMGKYLKITAYPSGSSATSLAWGTGAAGSYVKFQIPSDSSTANAGTFTFSAGETAGLSFSNASGWGGATGQITIAGMTMANTITRITIESSDS